MSPSRTYSSRTLLLGIPIFVARSLGGGFKTTVFFFFSFLLPILIVFWTVASAYSPRITNDKVKLPGRPVEHYIAQEGRRPPAMERSQQDPNEDALRCMTVTLSSTATSSTSWSTAMTGPASPSRGRSHFILFTFAPRALPLEQAGRGADPPQLRPRQRPPLYVVPWTPAQILRRHLLRPHTRETLEEMQDNKMAIVCEKLALKEESPFWTLVAAGAPACQVRQRQLWRPRHGRYPRP